MTSIHKQVKGHPLVEKSTWSAPFFNVVISGSEGQFTPCTLKKSPR